MTSPSIVQFTSKWQWKIVDCVWDSSLHATVDVHVMHCPLCLQLQLRLRFRLWYNASALVMNMLHAILKLKHVPSWNMFHFEKNLCHSITCFRLALCKHRHTKKKQTNKCSSLALLFLSLHKLLCFRTLHLTCNFNMTKFAQCQSEACFRMAHFFQNNTKCQSETCFRMACVLERHTAYALN